MGASAGSNVLCPTICTTNDMPIIQVPSFYSVGAANFQINPHYVEPDPGSTHQGETRDQRIIEYLKLNHNPVVALREGSWLLMDGGSLTLQGTTGARLFNGKNPPVEYHDGDDMSFLQFVRTT